MKLIVGLGNPGKKYENTRHNMGFLVLDRVSDITNIDIDKETFDGVVGRGKYLDENVILVKPSTFMNLSGNCVKQVVDYFKIPLEDILIIYDDMSIEVGDIRIRDKGSSGSHKGMQSVIDALHSEDIKRIRVGIGEPADKEQAIDFVLSKPLKEEKPLIDEALDRAANEAVRFINTDFHLIMSTYK